MDDAGPSRTALTMAALRAHHHLSTQEPRVLDDRLAMRFAGIGSSDDVNAHVSRLVETLEAFGDRSAAQEIVQDMTLCACARSRFAEDRLATSLNRGMKQLVVLGAGLDSTAYRCPDLTDGLNIFEVDYPTTQAWKRERLKSIGTAIPADVSFVPFDLELDLTRFCEHDVSTKAGQVQDIAYRASSVFVPRVSGVPADRWDRT